MLGICNIVARRHKLVVLTLTSAVKQLGRVPTHVEEFLRRKRFFCLRPTTNFVCDVSAEESHAAEGKRRVTTAPNIHVVFFSFQLLLLAAAVAWEPPLGAPDAGRGVSRATARTQHRHPAGARASVG